jgi:hypothetical protein
MLQAGHEEGSAEPMSLKVGVHAHDVHLTQERMTVVVVVIRLMVVTSMVVSLVMTVSPCVSRVMPMIWPMSR